MSAPTRSSIPDKYDEKLAWYAEREKELPDLKERAKVLEKDSYELRKVLATIDEIENGKLDFLLNTAPFLKRYFHASEEKKVPKQEGGRIHAYFTRDTQDNRGELYDEYMLEIENMCTPSYINRAYNAGSSSEDICATCNVAFVVDTVESALSCPSCGVNVSYIDTSSTKGLTYEQEQNSTSAVNFAYKRSNHLSEHLACFQGKETTSIPKEVIEALRAELKKQRITDSKRVTTAKVKELLKKLKLQKYYEHTQMITYELNGVRPPTIDQQTEETFKALFNEIQPVFERVRPKHRKNFLSYSYVLSKLSELLDRDDLVPFFPLLKSREKLYQQDQIWKDICRELKYEFIPSV